MTYANAEIPADGATGPSLEEQYEALKAEGLVSDDDTGASTGATPVAQGGAEGDHEEASTDDERPSWLPAKYKTVEEYVAYVSELEAKQGGTADDTAAPKGNEPTAEERAAAEAATTKAGLDLNTVSQEWADNGSLTAETYTKLADAGYPKEMVDIYIEGLTNRANAVQSQAFELVGGADSYGEMIDWAIQNLSDEDQAAFDSAVNSNNPRQAMLAIKGLKADWEASLMEDLSYEPESPVSTKGAAPVNTYQSLDDYMEDLNDPRYDTNESFRASVMAKLSRSKIM
ncbi:capsid assembly protein [Rhizobium sp. Leaf341]|uniref:capsid assembly protein n=1 Tax=Rhizobium sp. Leaf341 TaxID=1736344 RepID=UPI0007145558|nr:hypothetical protein [Rhizobium sp. Leaf341]KQR67874.1 hypothetical protein ASG03_10160 [Rhizobium sp. Leaf341]